MLFSVPLLLGNQIIELVLVAVQELVDVKQKSQGKINFPAELKQTSEFVHSQAVTMHMCWLSFLKGQMTGNIGIKVVDVLLARIHFPYWKILKNKTKLFSFKGHFQCAGFNEITFGFHGCPEMKMGQQEGAVHDRALPALPAIWRRTPCGLQVTYPLLLNNCKEYIRKKKTHSSMDEPGEHYAK